MTEPGDSSQLTCGQPETVGDGWKEIPNKINKATSTDGDQGPLEEDYEDVRDEIIVESTVEEYFDLMDDEGESGDNTYQHKSHQSPTGSKGIESITTKPRKIFVEWDDQRLKPFAKVSSTLTFRKYFSFNHCVYGTYLRMKNVSNGWITYWIEPSNSSKLCLKEDHVNGILAPNGSLMIPIVTHSMIPYNFVDIRHEFIQVSTAPINILVVQSTSTISISGIENDIIQSQIEKFWMSHLSKNVECHKIIRFRPYDLAYLSEPSEMWTQGRIARFIRGFGNSKTLFGFREMLKDVELPVFIASKLIQKFFDVNFNPERTIEIERAYIRSRTRRTFKRNMIKFTVISLGIYAFFIIFNYVNPTYPQ